MDKRFKHVMTQMKLVKNLFLATMQSVKQTLALGVHGVTVQVSAWKHLMEYQPGLVKKYVKTVGHPIA